jgi:amino acid transporter
LSVASKGAKNDPHTVFIEVVNSTGWSNQGFSFLFGFLSVAWVMTDYDATAHIAEEIKNPAIKAPVAIISALGTTYVLGWCLNIVMVICMGNAWATLLDTPTGLPAGQLFYNVLGKNGGIAFMALSTVICNFTGATALQAQARTLFALARGTLVDDAGLTFR